LAGTGTSVGADIFGACRRCGEVWLVVVAVMNGRIARVECKQCGARHAHRSSQGERAVAAGPKVARSARTRRGPSSDDVEADPSRPPRPYRPSDQYTAGDRMLHPRFGEGVVQAVHGPKKVLVRFSSGDKTLIQARDAG
jgi:transcription elongation factor Elf1